MEVFAMTRKMEIEILMEDRCTKSEAEKHLKNGTIIFEDFEENFEKYMDEWDIEEEEREVYRNMIETGEPITDWGVVKLEGKTYYIMYVLQMNRVFYW